MHKNTTYYVHYRINFIFFLFHLIWVHLCCLLCIRWYWHKTHSFDRKKAAVCLLAFCLQLTSMWLYILNRLVVWPCKFHTHFYSILSTCSLVKSWRNRNKTNGIIEEDTTKGSKSFSDIISLLYFHLIFVASGVFGIVLTLYWALYSLLQVLIFFIFFFFFFLFFLSMLLIAFHVSLIK